LGYCYTWNGFKFFRKAGLLSGNVSVNNETIAEGEPAFSEWLKQSEIKTFEHVPDIEDFVNTDDGFGNIWSTYR
jgi:hypothetical protein